MNCIDCGHDVNIHVGSGGGCFHISNPGTGLTSQQIYDCDCKLSCAEAKKKSDPELGPVIYTVSEDVWKRVMDERKKIKEFLDILTMQSTYIYDPNYIYKLAKQFQNEIMDADERYGELR